MIVDELQRVLEEPIPLHVRMREVEGVQIDLNAAHERLVIQAAVVAPHGNLAVS